MHLADYLAQAVLPPMLMHPESPQLPPSGHKSHQNFLYVRSEEYRVLEQVKPVSLDNIPSQWNTCVTPPLRLNRGNVRGSKCRLSVPTEKPCNIIPEYEQDVLPLDIAEITPIIRSLPINTATRAMHLTVPDAADWEFRFIAGDQDRDLFLHYLWSPADENTISEELKSRQLVFAYQPPWILSDKDIEDFSQSTSIPSFLNDQTGLPNELASKERVWAKLWDICQRHGTAWFILTSYNKWVFGRFSDQWSTGFISDVYDYNCTDPTIMELMLFWLCSAMKLTTERFHFMPQVSESNLTSKLPDVSELPTIQAAPSVSDWDGRDDESKSSAGVVAAIAKGLGYAQADQISDTGVPTLATPAALNFLPRGRTIDTLSWSWSQTRIRKEAKLVTPFSRYSPLHNSRPTPRAAAMTEEPASEVRSPTVSPVVTETGWMHQANSQLMVA